MYMLIQSMSALHIHWPYTWAQHILVSIGILWQAPSMMKIHWQVRYTLTRYL